MVMMFMAFHGFPNRLTVEIMGCPWPWRPWRPCRPWPQGSSAQGRRGWSASRNVIWWCFRFQWDEPCWTMLNYRSWTWSNPVFCLQNSIWINMTKIAYEVGSNMNSWLSCYTIPFEHPCIYPNKACLSHVLVLGRDDRREGFSGNEGSGWILRSI